MTYRDLDHFDRALDDFATGDPYETFEPVFGLSHVAAHAYAAAMTTGAPGVHNPAGRSTAADAPEPSLLPRARGFAVPTDLKP